MYVCIYILVAMSLQNFSTLTCQKPSRVDGLAQKLVLDWVTA